MERHELAEKCERIEKVGGNIREFLKDQGFVSPWGTWYRLQIEELGRKGNEITEGRGKGEMKRLTREQKAEAVRIALDGGSPLAYLRTLGSKSPGATWFNLRKTLQETDPETYQKLMEEKTKEQEEDMAVTTCCAPAPESGVEVPDELPGDGLGGLMDGLTVTGIKTGYGEFHISNNGFLYFGANDHREELEMPVDVWLKFWDDAPRIRKILGI